MTLPLHSSSDKSQLSSRLSLPCIPPSAGRARRFIKEHLLSAGFDEDALGEIVIAAGEAVTNAIEHGCAKVPDSEPAEMEFRVYTLDGSLVIEVRDHGPGFDPKTARRTDKGDAVEERGRGLTIIHALMDTVTLSRTDEGMMIRMTRRLPG